jgi:hypothetical protein
MNQVITDRCRSDDQGGETRGACWWADRFKVAGNPGFYVYIDHSGPFASRRSHYAVADDFGDLQDVGPRGFRKQEPDTE